MAAGTGPVIGPSVTGRCIGAAAVFGVVNSIGLVLGGVETEAGGMVPRGCSLTPRDGLGAGPLPADKFPGDSLRIG